MDDTLSHLHLTLHSSLVFLSTRNPVVIKLESPVVSENKFDRN